MVVMKKVVYVTGITGFIGRNLLTHLSCQFQKVINFTRRGTIQIFENGVLLEQNLSLAIIKENPSKILINLATLYEPYPKTSEALGDLIEANILFPSRVLQALSEIRDLKIINALSYHQLLDLTSQNIYSLSKELYKKYLDIQNVQVVNIYIFDTFGAGDTRNKVTDTFIKNILLGKALTIPKNQIHINLSDSEAISSSIMACLDQSSGDYSLRSPDTLSLESLARTLMDLLKVEVKIIKENHGINFLDLVNEFPRNIFTPPQGYDFKESLANRINEIKNAS
jgi:nucleoside-diphosphate-sugar epimerase